MSAQITVTKNDEIAIIKVVGSPTVPEILDVNRDLVEDGAYVVEKRLWDFREVQVDFSAAELGKIAAFSRHIGQNCAPGRG